MAGALSVVYLATNCVLAHAVGNPIKDFNSFIGSVALAEVVVVVVVRFVGRLVPRPEVSEK